MLRRARDKNNIHLSINPYYIKIIGYLRAVSLSNANLEPISRIRKRYAFLWTDKNILDKYLKQDQY